MKLCHKMKVYKRGHNPENPECKPEIRLVGKWLEEAGFKIGDPIYIIKHGQGRITIEDEQTYFLLRT